MKKIILLACSSLLLAQLSPAQKTIAKNGSAKMIELSPYFSFASNTSPKATITQQNAKADFKAGTNKEDGFTIKMNVNLQQFSEEKMLLDIPGILSVKLRQADPSDRHRQNYPASTMPDGSLPVLEASLTLTSPVIQLFKRQLDIGFPLAAIRNPWGQHELILNFDGIKWTAYMDGELMDNDFAIGYPHFGNQSSCTINPPNVSQAQLFFPAIEPMRAARKQDEKLPELQYWTPRGHNSWVGDVATLYNNGRYHVFYLYDRRHHASKLGVGGHYFEHFSTTDFITWTEHEAATPITEQWETFGTGTPFMYKNKLHLSYGLHTSRIYPDSLSKYLGIPSGSTYSVSEDNISNFKKSGVVFHYSENPSIFTTADGSLKMFANYRAKGTWVSETLDSGWYSTDPVFPLGGDCTFYFPWGKYQYIVGGFESLWKRVQGAADTTWQDEVAAGKDFYNGLSVPSVSPIHNGRYIMAGWIPITGWGGPFIIHELLQLPDGRLRTKWMPELIPATLDTIALSKKIETNSSFPVESTSFMLSFEVHPGKKKGGQLAVNFLASGDSPYEKAAALQIDLNALTAQYNTAVKDEFAAPEKSLRQDAAPHGVFNYAIENITGTTKSFTVRIVVKNNSKFGGSILDTEIAAQNTLISYRHGLTVKNIAFNLKDVSIRNIKVMKLVD